MHCLLIRNFEKNVAKHNTSSSLHPQVWGEMEISLVKPRTKEREEHMQEGMYYGYWFKTHFLIHAAVHV